MALLVRASSRGLLLLALAGCAEQATPMAPALTVDTGRVEVSGSSLFYERAGAGKTVVLLHANYVDRRMWDPQFQELARQFDVIRYDARGLGRSGPSRTPFSPADDLRRLLEGLGVRRTALVGSSMGGATALDFAVTHSSMVSGIVLIGSGLNGYAWPPTDLREPWRLQARAALAKGDTTGVATAWLQSDYLRVIRTDSVLSHQVMRLLAENVSLWKGLIQDQRDWDSSPEPSTLLQLPTITAPVLVIVGAEDTPDLRAIADSLRIRIPNARQVVLEGADHFPGLEQPGRVRELIAQFLR